MRSHLSAAIVVVCALLVVGGKAVATDYTWTGGSAAWDDTAHWEDAGAFNPTSGQFTGTADTFTAPSGMLIADDTPSWAAKLTLQGNGNPDGYSGATFSLTEGDNIVAKDLRLDGARFAAHAHTGNTYSNGSVDATTALTISNTVWFDMLNLQGGRGVTMNGQITGSGTIVVDADPGYFRLNGAASTYTGSWNVRGGRLEAYASGALGSGTVYVNGGTLRTDGTHTSVPVIYCNGGTVYIYGSSTLPDLHLNGTRLDSRASNVNLTIGAGEYIHVDGDSTIRGPVGSGAPGKNLNIYATLSGTHKLTFDSEYSNAWTNLYRDSRATYSGEIVVEGAGVLYRATGAFGTGTVTFNGGRLQLVADMAGGGRVDMHNATFGPSSGTRTADDVHMYGGTIRWDGQTGGLQGNIWIEDDVRVYLTRNDSGKHFYFDATLHGSAPVTVDFSDSHSGHPHFHLGQDNRATFDGGFVISDAKVELDDAGALGSGTTLVTASGVLYTKNNGVLAGPPAITVGDGGYIAYQSTETALVTVNKGGAIHQSSGSTAFQYDPDVANQTVSLAEGAILYKTLGTSTPSYNVVKNKLRTGDGRFGLYYGDNTGTNDTWTFGDDGSNIWRGLAVMTRGNATWSGVHTTVTPASTPLQYYAQDKASMTFNGATLNATQAILDGNGDYYFAGAVLGSGSIATVDKYGAGKVQVSAAGGLPAGRTINVHEGYLKIGDGAALDNASDVNIGDGGIFLADIAVTSGSVHLADGAGVAAKHASGLGPAGTFDWSAGGQQLLLGVDNVANLPTTGGVDFVAHGDRDTSEAVELGDGKRLTAWGGNTVGGSGHLVAAGATGARVAARTGYQLTVGKQLDFAGKELIVGDTADFNAINTSGTGWADLSQAGVVELANTSNQVGTVDVRAGELLLDVESDFAPAGHPGHIGGCTDVRVADGAVLHLNTNRTSRAWTLNAVVSGNGDVRATSDFAGDNGIIFAPTATADAGLSPGDSVGTLAIRGDVSFGSRVLLGTLVTLDQDTATYSQSGYTVDKATDGTIDATGWAISPGNGAVSAQTAAWEVVSGAEPDAGEARISLQHQYGNSIHTLGRFRLAYTTADRGLFCDGATSSGSIGEEAIWTILAPNTVASAAGATMSVHTDSSVLVTTPGSGNTDTYTLTCSLPAGVTGLRLETLKDDDIAGLDLPQNGPGYGSTNGNFVLSEFQLLEPDAEGNFYRYGQMRIDVASAGGTPGVDNDLVTVTGNANLANSELVLNLPAPSSKYNPAVASNTFLTAGGLSGAVASVALSDDMDPGVADHWDVGTHHVVNDGTSAALVLTGTSWTGHKGDATLNDVVDVLDLARLANNFGKTDADWLDADFNLDGIVDVLDLAAIANNFGYDGTGGGDGGGAPVPEPASLAVLALGGAALLRRRRR